MAPKILIVLTSVDKIPSTGNPTGWYLVRPNPQSPFPSPSLPYRLKLTRPRASSPTPSTPSTLRPS